MVTPRHLALWQPWGVKLAAFILVVLVGPLVAPTTSAGADHAEDDAKRRAWLEERLAPLRSDDIDLFKKACLQLAEEAKDITVHFPNGETPSWAEAHKDYYTLIEAAKEPLKARLREPQPDVQFVVYALKATRGGPRDEFFQDAIRLLDSDSVAVQCEAIHILVPPYPGIITFRPITEQQEMRAFRRVMNMCEGPRGEQYFQSTGDWGPFLTRIDRSGDEFRRLKRLGEKYLSSEGWEARRAAAGLLATLDMKGYESALLDALKKERNVEVAFSIAEEAAALRPNQELRDRMTWATEVALHPLALQQKPIGAVRLQDKADSLDASYGRVESRLRVLALARQRVLSDPGVLDRAVAYAHDGLILGEKVQEEPIRKTVTRTRFSFSEDDAAFWLKHGMDKKLCEVLLEASKAVQKTATDTGGGKEPK